MPFTSILSSGKGAWLYTHVDQALGVGCPGVGRDLGQAGLQLSQVHRGLTAEGYVLPTILEAAGVGGSGGHHNFCYPTTPLSHSTNTRLIQ